jgi:hypothetical protein
MRWTSLEVTTRQDLADDESLLHLPLPLTTLLASKSQHYTSTMADRASYVTRALKALFVVYTSFTASARAYILFWMLYFPKHEQPEDPKDVHEVLAMLTSRTLEVASLLQHIKSAAGEKCTFCHDDEPIAPVRISCQHVFCCGCAHAVFARHVLCPLCFRKPLPQQKIVPVQAFQPVGLDVRGRLALMYTIGAAYVVFCGIPAALVLYFADCKLVLRDLPLFQCLFVVLLLLWLIILLVINRSRWLTARFARRA